MTDVLGGHVLMWLMTVDEAKDKEKSESIQFSLATQLGINYGVKNSEAVVAQVTGGCKRDGCVVDSHYGE